MSVLLETSLGDLVLDLDVDRAPKVCLNFLKLCKTYKYNYCAFFSVQRNFLAQTGDPTSTGTSGSSIWSQLPRRSKDYTPQPFFKPEVKAESKHTQRGTVSMALSPALDDLVAGSQFFVTLADNLDYLDGKHAPFATVVEGQEEGETLDKINAAFTDDKNRPMRDIRIKHVIVLGENHDALGRSNAISMSMADPFSIHHRRPVPRSRRHASPLSNSLAHSRTTRCHSPGRRRRNRRRSTGRRKRRSTS